MSILKEHKLKLVLITVLFLTTLFNFFSLLGANYVKDTSTLLLFDYHTWGVASPFGNKCKLG